MMTLPPPCEQLFCEGGARLKKKNPPSCPGGSVVGKRKISVHRLAYRLFDGDP
jgi:hypothetical protein